MRIFLGGSFCNRVSWVGTIAFVHAHSADDSSDHVRCHCKDWPRDYSVENVPMAGTQREPTFTDGMGRGTIGHNQPYGALFE